jgi:uncharacterized Fe-S cluster-containing protein
LEQLPGLNCGSCGFGGCEGLAAEIVKNSAGLDKCVAIKNGISAPKESEVQKTFREQTEAAKLSGGCSNAGASRQWKDFLGREYDFVLHLLPGDPGPRETILPHNPSLTRELNIQKGDILIGRPLGMSCGCPITHSGIVIDADHKTGVIVWCVTGPLRPRMTGFKDMGYYIAEAYEGIVTETRSDLKVGMRYWFQPQMCMLQWRHSGLINFLTRTKEGTQIRIEGLFIG